MARPQRIDRVEPGPGQESVWDYPRPPRVETSSERVEVELGGQAVAGTTTSWRVLETSHPPTYYLPARRLRARARAPGGRRAHLVRVEGPAASYFDLVVDDLVALPRAAWTYLSPPRAPASRPDRGGRCP